MAKKRSRRLEVVGPRADGTLYSRVMRRSVALIGALEIPNSFNEHSFAESIHHSPPVEFRVPPDDNPMQVDRIKTYLRFLRALEILSTTEESGLVGKRPQGTSDKAWSAFLARQAVLYLQRALKRDASAIAKQIRLSVNRAHNRKQIPKLDLVIADLRKGTEAPEEFVRWSLYLRSDDPQAGFRLRRPYCVELDPE